MNRIVINGSVETIQVDDESEFSHLVAYLRTSLNSDSQVIASFKVNGEELTEESERTLGEKRVSEIEEVEIVTTHPRELAEDTLKILKGFTQELVKMSHTVSEQSIDKAFEEKLLRLLDGIEIFVEGISNARNLLRLYEMKNVDQLELDLSSILQDLLAEKRSGNSERVKALLRETLPHNFREWGDQVIPEMIRARDS